MRTLKAIFGKLVSDDKANSHKILNLLTLSGAIVAAVALVSTAIIEPHVQALVVIGVIIVAAILILLTANLLNKPLFAAILLNIIFNLFLFPYMFFTSGGINSGCPLFLLVGLILAFATVPRKKIAAIIYCIDLIGPVTALILGYYHPELIETLDTELAATADVLVSLILVSISLSVVYRYQGFFYEKQQEKVEENARLANAATEAKTNFLSNMTHDIRTPMNAIIGYTEIARKNATNKMTLLSALTNISVASEHLLSLVNDVLEMSRIESGRFELQCEPASITELIDKVETIMRPEMEDINLHLVIDTSEVEDDTINCDVLRLTQILINVLGNAVKYSHPDGHVYLSVAQKENAAIDSIMCEIKIRDEGIGIGSDFLPHVFEPFTREKTTTVSGIPGSGLGLSITKTMVEMMRGTISVRSESGKGSEFIIRIPFDVPTLVEYDTAEELMKKYNFEGNRILVVEDNELNCEIVKEIMQEVGCEVDTARDGTYAIEKIRLSPPGYYDAVLMDVQMPLMSGYETTEIIRSLDNEKLANIPIIALTANAFDADREKALSSGMNDFVSKPIINSELMSTLQNYLK